MKKECIYLTDITLHTRGFRPTVNFAKVAHKNRMYSPMPKDYAKNVNTENHTVKMVFELPEDLTERWERGEVEIMIPKDGLLIYAGKDVWEFIAKEKEKERRSLIHHGRTWHAKDK